MERIEAKVRDISFRSEKNGKVVTVHGSLARKVANIFESDETVLRYQTNVTLEYVEGCIDSTGIRASFLDNRWQSDFMVERIDGSIEVYTLFDYQYRVVDLLREDSRTYRGRLYEDEADTGIDVKIRFEDVDDKRFLTMTFWDEYEEDYIDFMFDYWNKRLIKEEPEGDSDPILRYRRYRILYSDEIVFFGALAETETIL